MPDALAPRVLRDDAGETVRGILLVVLAYVGTTLGDVAGKWSLPAAGVAGVMIGRGVSGGLVVAALAVQAGGWRRLVPVRLRLVHGLAHGPARRHLRDRLHRAAAHDRAGGADAGRAAALAAGPVHRRRVRGRAHHGPARQRAVGPGDAGAGARHPRHGHDADHGAAAQHHQTPECLTFWLMLAHLPMGILLLPLLPGSFALPGDAWVALGLVGLLNGTGHCLLARGYALAPVSALAPYEYTTLIWGGIAGFVVFHEVPGWSSLAGAAVVAAAGLYNLHRERVRRGGAACS